MSHILRCQRGNRRRGFIGNLGFNGFIGNAHANRRRGQACSRLLPHHLGMLGARFTSGGTLASPAPHGRASRSRARWGTTPSSFWLVLLGEGCARIGRVEEGLRVLAEATVMAHTRGLRVWEAELNRLQGELLLRQAVAGRHRPPPADPPASTGCDVWVRDPSRLCIEAEACFRQALENAHEQHAKSLELRATMSLSRLWQQLGNTSVARERLKESYHWFTESFDTADLRKAMALREALE